MSDLGRLDRIFQFIMQRMVETGVAPHYTDIGAALGLGMEEARLALRDLFAAGIPGWLFPGTSLIASFAPFNNLPTQYRIAVDGWQKWYGQ